MKKNYLFNKKVLAEMIKSSTCQRSLFQELAERNAKGDVITDIEREKRIDDGNFTFTFHETCEVRLTRKKDRG